jgi:hypothetical protein
MDRLSTEDGEIGYDEGREGQRAALVQNEGRPPERLNEWIQGKTVVLADRLFHLVEGKEEKNLIECVSPSQDQRV